MREVGRKVKFHYNNGAQERNVLFVSNKCSAREKFFNWAKLVTRLASNGKMFLSVNWINRRTNSFVINQSMSRLCVVLFYTGNQLIIIQKGWNHLLRLRSDCPYAVRLDIQCLSPFCVFSLNETKSSAWEKWAEQAVKLPSIHDLFAVLFAVFVVFIKTGQQRSLDWKSLLVAGK